MFIDHQFQEKPKTKVTDSLDNLSISKLRDLLPEQIEVDGFVYRFYIMQMPLTGQIIAKYALYEHGAGYLLTRGKDRKDAIINMLREIQNIKF